MIFSWVTQPARYPHRCLTTFQSDAEHGPYLDTGLDYFQPMIDERGRTRVRPVMHRLYLSGDAIAQWAGANGSPIAVLDAALETERAQALDQARQELDAAKARVEELEAEVALLRERSAPVDEEALAQRLADAMEGRFARKTGPKPRRAA